MEYLLGLIALLAGWAFFERTKRKSAEGLNENLETKEKLLEKEKEVFLNEAKLKAEKQKQAELNWQLEEERKKDETVKEILDFFNDKFNNK